MNDRDLPEVLADADVIGHALELKPALIRQWATRSKIQRRGRDARGRTLFSLDDVARVAGVEDA